MKIKTPYSLTILLLLLCSCSNQLQVKSDYDKDVDIKLYKTYAWLNSKDIELKNNPLLYNELTDKRIKSAVNQQLPVKGLRYSENDPDIRVHYHIIVEDKSAINPTLLDHNYSTYWTQNQMDVYQYTEGTLIIDLMDARNNNLVWRGWGISILNDNNLDLSEKEINEAVDKILKEFPPKNM